MNTLEILEELVAFDTVSSKTNLPMIEWIERYLESYGVSGTRVPDATGEKASLYAAIGPSDRQGFVLSGHTDVVPVEGQEWSSDPFKLRVDDGRAYARGACDMKGFLACILAAVPAMVNASLQTPLVLAFSYDEEVGCTGVRPMLEEMNEWNPKPKGCFVGEPTDMSVVVGSSLAPQAVNALEYAARLVTLISDIGKEKLKEGARDELYDVPHTTAHVGRFVAGTQLNIVPAAAEFDFEFRAVAADDPFKLLKRVEELAAELEQTMREIDPDCSIEFLPYSQIAGLDTSADAEIAVLAKRLAGRNDHSKVAFSTEAGLFDEMAGVPAVVVGPGSIEQAHKADEFVSLDQLKRCDGFLVKLIDHLAS